MKYASMIALCAVLAVYFLPFETLWPPVSAQTEQPRTPDTQNQQPEAAKPVKPEGSMTLARLGTLIRRLDGAAKSQADGRHWQFSINAVQVAVVSDPKYNRMRILIPLKPSGDMEAEELKRLTQANFDTALDVRYAIARNVLWAVYIHPLSELHDRQFIAAIGQTVNAATTYGTTYSSGLLTYGGGDSRGIIQRKLIDELLKKGGQDI